MAYTRAEWNKRQAKLPEEDRTSYETYLSFQSPTPEPKPAETSAPTAEVNPIAAAIPVAGVVNTPRNPKPKPNSAATMPPTMTPTPKPAKPSSDSYTQFGPLGGLSSGAVGDVLAPTGYDANGNPTGIQGNEFTGAQPFLEAIGQTLADLYISQGLNADGSTIVDPIIPKKEEKEDPDPLRNPDIQPDSPDGFEYIWTDGIWKLYPVKNNGGGGGSAGDDKPAVDLTATPSTSVDVLKALLRAQGFSDKILDSSTSYLNSLLKDNIDYDNAITLFLNTKEYTLKNGTKLTSPFYTEYGYLNEGLANPKDAGELFNAVEGYRGLQQKYGFSDKYLSQEALKNYVKNNVTVLDLDERANTARLAAIQADTAKTDALVALGYIASKEGLQDFYLDPKIGKEQLESNRNTGAFVAEAIRRAGTGISSQPGQIEGMKALAASLTEKGYSEAQISQLASTGFEEIGRTLQPLTKLESIYGVNADKDAIQKQLQAEQFQGTESQLRKKRKEQEELAFQRKSGTFGAGRGYGGSLGTRSTTGAI
jgi:hypothetical protein